MSRVRRAALAAWVLLVVAYTFAAGFAVPPREGVADPDAAGATSTAQLERLMDSSTGGVDRLSLTPSTSAHGPAEVTTVVAPERATYPTEDDVLDRFLRDGGTLVVFAANTAWNDFLSRYRIQLEGSTLLPAGNRTASNILTLELPVELGAGQMLLPNATAVDAVHPNATSLQPDEETVLDEDGNGTIEVPPDQAGAFPVAATQPVGEGRIVVVASSEAVLGHGIERNLDAVGGLLDAVAAEEPSALDAATHPRGWQDLARAPAAATLAAGQGAPAGLAVLGVLGAGLVLALPPRPLTHEGGGRLDEYTEVTREVMLDRGD